MTEFQKRLFICLAVGVATAWTLSVAKGSDWGLLALLAVIVAVVTLRARLLRLLLRLLGASGTALPALPYNRMAPTSKPCTHSGCDGVMTVDDDWPWASYERWVCDQHPEHERVLAKEGTPGKPCSVDACFGVMRFDSRHRRAGYDGPWEWPWSCTWVCERDATHAELIPEAEVRQMVRCGVIPPEWG